MTTSAPSYDLVQAQQAFYKSATRLANLWYVLTIIGLIVWILSLILSCVGAFVAANAITPLIEDLLRYGF